MLRYSCVNFKYMHIYWVPPTRREMMGDMIIYIDRQGDSVPEERGGGLSFGLDNQRRCYKAVVKVGF